MVIVHLLNKLFDLVYYLFGYGHGILRILCIG